MKIFELHNVSVRYGALTIVDNASFSVAEGEWHMLIGPNGAGKSTIVNAIAQAVPYEGNILFEGSNVSRMKTHILAQKIGFLAQNHSVTYPFSVGEVVRLGRYAYAPGIFSKKKEEDESSVYEALEICGLLPMVNQSVLTLSGGELQRTFLAQILAQDPQVLILDEPSNHLDLVFQKQMFALLMSWIKQPGRAVVSVVHDLSLAKAYGSHALLLDKGKTIAQGRINEVFTNKHLDHAYNMDVYAWMQSMLNQWSN